MGPTLSVVSLGYSLILWAAHFLLTEAQKSGSLPSFLVSVPHAKQAVFANGTFSKAISLRGCQGDPRH